MASTRAPLDVTRPAAEEHPVERGLRNAPVDAAAFSPDDIAHLEAIHDEPLGRGLPTSDILVTIAERAKREG